MVRWSSGFALVAGSKHADILLKALLLLNLTTSLWINEGHLSLYTTLLDEKLFVLTSFFLGLFAVSIHDGRSKMNCCKDEETSCV